MAPNYRNPAAAALEKARTRLEQETSKLRLFFASFDAPIHYSRTFSIYPWRGGYPRTRALADAQGVAHSVPWPDASIGYLPNCMARSSFNVAKAKVSRRPPSRLTRPRLRRAGYSTLHWDSGVACPLMMIHPRSSDRAMVARDLFISCNVAYRTLTLSSAGSSFIFALYRLH